MTFIYCKECEWGQDDFWNEQYNPFDSLMYWKEILIKSLELPPEKRVFTCDIEFVSSNQISAKKNESGVFEIPLKEFLALEIEKSANSVRNMKWMTYEEYVNDPNPTCPICGSTNLSED